jgi:dTDP-4-dehydrorhamnose 3,5-epimerase
MLVRNTFINGLKIIKSKKYHDTRGYFREIFKNKLLKTRFIFACLSRSKKNVFRGFHIQTKNSQTKFVSVIKGEILDIVIDLRKKSKTFGKVYKIRLSEKNAKSIFIPNGFAHGFLGLKKENIVYYVCDKYRDKNSETGIIWNDKDIKIKWPTKKIILSAKDKRNITINQYKEIYLK